jgi:hypothetical protein
MRTTCIVLIAVLILAAVAFICYTAYRDKKEEL